MAAQLKIQVNTGGRDTVHGNPVHNAAGHWSGTVSTIGIYRSNNDAGVICNAGSRGQDKFLVATAGTRCIPDGDYQFAP